VKLLVCAVGRLKAGPERELATRYQERIDAIGRGLGLGPLSVAEVDESRARRADDRKAEEGARLFAAAGSAAIVSLDERGASLTSEAFAARLRSWRDEGHGALAFLIGGADGQSEAVAARSVLNLGLGAMTWPHQIVRILLAEQIYRAATIIAGHPYHRV
jgi:23S rRNA (pseudouridine1915-N3)-methyltransferase